MTTIKVERGKIGYKAEPVRADVELAIVYTCANCREPNYIDLDNDGAKETLLIEKAAETITTGKQQRLTVEHECCNCFSMNKIKTLVYK